MLKRAGIFFLYLIIFLTSLFLLEVKLLAQNSVNQDTETRDSRILNTSIDNLMFHLLPSEFNFRGIRCIYKDYKGIMP